jgi:ABC-type bacteriocin/lantibiotic exporter with double-glycine peptidase domain
VKDPRHPRRARLSAWVVAAAALGGCYHGSARSISPSDLRRDPNWVVVEGVPLLKQSAERDCGAAALAMMLGKWGPPFSSSSAEILKTVPMDPAHGIAAGTLRDFARRRGLRAFLISGEIADLTREVGLGRPVLVGLVQVYGDKAYTHYEVVVGINARARRVLMFDPGRGPREDGFEGFAAEWSRAGRLAIVVTTPPNTPGAPAARPVGPPKKDLEQPSGATAG